MKGVENMRHFWVALAVATAMCPAVASAGDYPEQILAVHNRERAAVGVPPAVWNEKLANHAAAWAAKLAELGRLQHSRAGDRPGEGENLWMGSAGGYSPTEMADGWALEKRYFRYGAYPDVSTGNEVVGHYSQMIWRSSTQIGCAIVFGRKWDILVCRYSAPGNVTGEKPY
jgi:hypothetical protein